MRAGHARLDLGSVAEVAAVRVNGHEAGVLWKAPYAEPVDGMLHAGANAIEIDVTNLWPNRLIGDAQEPAAKHYTSTNIRKFTQDSPLLPSGLMGPVKIEPIAVVRERCRECDSKAEDRSVWCRPGSVLEPV